MRKTDTVAFANRRGVNATPLELIHKGMIMIGSHTCPSTALNLCVEYGYQLWNLHVCEQKRKLDVIDVLLHNLNILKWILKKLTPASYWPPWHYASARLASPFRTALDAYRLQRYYTIVQPIFLDINFLIFFFKIGYFIKILP